MSIASTAPLNFNLDDVEERMPTGRCWLSLKNCCDSCGFAVISEVHEEKETTPMETHDISQMETHDIMPMETHDTTLT